MGIPIVIYAAHGFLFFKGAPVINRTLYRLQEKWLARYTDVLITINAEDFEAAGKLKLRNNGKKYMIHGAGVETGKKVTVDRDKKRKELNIPQDSFMIVSGGFLNANKNNKVVIEALSYIKQRNIYYVACGEGEKRDQLIELASSLGLQSKVLLPGFRTDFSQILASADAFVMPSFRQGVPRALLEAMDLGIPCIGSKTRGIRELIGENLQGGYLCNPRNAKEFASAITNLMDYPSQTSSMALRNKKEALKYSKDIVCDETKKIYMEVLS